MVLEQSHFEARGQLQELEGVVVLSMGNLVVGAKTREMLVAAKGSVRSPFRELDEGAVGWWTGVDLNFDIKLSLVRHLVGIVGSEQGLDVGVVAVQTELDMEAWVAAEGFDRVRKGDPVVVALEDFDLQSLEVALGPERATSGSLVSFGGQVGVHLVL